MTTTTTVQDTPIPPARANLGTAWPFIEEGINLIMTNSPTGISYKKSMSLQTVIYNCSSTNPTSLDLYNSLSEYLTRRLTGLREGPDNLQEEALLEYYSHEWKQYRTGAGHVNRLFTYLNRHQIKREREKGKSDIYPVYTLVVVLWETVFLMYIQGPNARLTATILRMIERQRSGEEIDEGLVKDVVDSFVTLGPNVFQEHIQIPFLERYGDGYGNFLGSSSIEEYLKVGANER